MVCARLKGSSASSGSGRPWPTSQNGQRRVQMSPMIMNVAVPLLKHSPMFGHEASSHTVCRRCSRRIFLISLNRGDDGARTRIQSGFFSRSAAITLIGMREVFAAPVCLIPASLMPSP